jgi:hypothetical protein
VLTLFAWLTLSLAQASGFVGLCLEPGMSLAAAKNYLQEVAAPNDKIHERSSKNCLEIMASASRLEVFERYLAKRYRIISRYHEGVVEDEIPTGPPCHLSVEKIGKGNAQRDTTAIKKGGRLSRTEETFETKTSSRLMLSPGRRGRIGVNGTQVELLCSVRGGSRYEIDVYITTPKGEISTNIQTVSGNRVNLGQLVEELNRRSRTIGVPDGVELKKETGHEVSDYFLTAQ